MKNFTETLKQRRQLLPSIDILGTTYKVKPASPKTAQDALFHAINYHGYALAPLPSDDQDFETTDEKTAAAVETTRKQGVIATRTNRDIRVFSAAAQDLGKFRAFHSLLNEDGTGIPVEQLPAFLDLLELESDIETRINEIAGWEAYDQVNAANVPATTPEGESNPNGESTQAPTLP